ncbi:MAG TPA: hypothetical protein VN442_06680 [Bryobacteraceae bacterium]|nr:hypothetical protein [Bryobacteraceae bacterium]
MTPTILPLNQKIRKPAAAMSALVDTRQRTLEQLYLRRATLENLIQSLEIYDRANRTVNDKVVSLR